MFPPRSSEQNPLLTDAIDRVLRDMEGVTSNDPEYAKMVKQLSELYALKELDKPKRLSPDSMLAVAGNLAGIILIIRYERTQIVTTKALSLLLKIRL